MIPFKQIPSNIRVPLFYCEIDPSRANRAQFNQRALMIGQKTSGGSATANQPVICSGVDDAKGLAGQGSILALMAAAYRAQDLFGELWLLPLPDADGATAASGGIAIGAAATAPGALPLYVAGQRVSVALTGAQTAAQTATAIAAAINAVNDLPVTAAADSADVTLTAKNAGLAGNDIDIRFNYRGVAGGEAFPAGFAATITAMSGGATNPTLTTALANLTDEPFDFIAIPWTDATSLNALRDFLSDNAGRWSWSVQVFGHMIAAFRGTFGNRVTLGTGRNDPHASIMGFYDAPTPNWQWAASVAGQVAASVRADPGLPLGTLPLNGILPPPLQSRDSLTTRNTLLYDGISTYTVDGDGTVRIERLITTYQKNAFNQPDDSFLRAETMFLLMFVLRSLRTLVTSRYSRVKLADDGTRFEPGANVVTPAIIREDLIAHYRELEAQGYVQNSEAFAEGLIVERNAADRSRIDVLWTGSFIDQLNTLGLLAQFR